MTDTFKKTIRIEPVSNGGFIVSTDPKPSEFNWPTHAFTNAADLLAWITGELAPQSPAAPDGEGWRKYTPGPLPIQPVIQDKWVDVKTRQGLVLPSRNPLSLDWSTITHWRPSK
jgi:hypothetical protein